MKRTPTDKCLLCETKESTRANSHWVPASLLKSMISKRDKEESNAIIAYLQSRLDTDYGRSNLKNPDVRLREHHYALDYIFCDNCENRLAVIEGIVQKIIQDDIRLPNKRTNYQEDLSFLNIPFKTSLRLDNSIYRLFIYPIIWRISMIYRLKYGFQILEFDQENNLKRILDKYLNLDPVDMENNGDKIPNYDFRVLSADTFKPDTGNIVYTEKIYKNPNVYYGNEFIILFYPKGYAVGDQDSYHIPIRSIIEFVYGTGLRLSEALNIMFLDIDGDRLHVRVNKGQGAKDQVVQIPECLAQLLRSYYRRLKPVHYLFYGFKEGSRYSNWAAQWSIVRARKLTVLRKYQGFIRLETVTLRTISKMVWIWCSYKSNWATKSKTF
jgi:integrase